MYKLTSSNQTPADDCWPSASKWKSLNTTVHGSLIANEPIGKPCYNGPGKDDKLCQAARKGYTDSFFLEKFPTGYQYPLLDACAPINGTIANNPLCDLGNYPVYTINATKPVDVAAGIKFAKDNNVRLVIKNTGHDIRQRSQGYGSLSIWMRGIKAELEYQEKYTPSNASCPSDWKGSAIVVGAGYIWNDVYAFAAKHGKIATVGAVGGYIQGGGHGPASHAFGLATDQVLEYKVVLASGDVVIANACQNTDLFTALRGGGGGTFGVVVSATIKAHPTRAVLGHKLQVYALTSNISILLNATAEIASKYPILSDEGFSGIGDLSRVDGAPSFYVHDFNRMLENNSSSEVEHAKQVMTREVLEILRPLNGTKLIVKSTFSRHDTFQDYYLAGGHQSKSSNSPILVSRFFDEKSLLHQQKNLVDMFQTIFSRSGPGLQPSASVLELFLIGGGQVLKPVMHTSVHPAWRKTYMLAELVEITPPNSGLRGIKQVRDQAISKKLKAMKDAAPGTGTYMNEADPYDADWKKDWYGDYDWLKSVKDKYDPDGVFWCWRCVGSEGWDEVKGGTLYGPLCQS